MDALTKSLSGYDNAGLSLALLLEFKQWLNDMHDQLHNNEASIPVAYCPLHSYKMTQFSFKLV